MKLKKRGRESMDNIDKRINSEDKIMLEFGRQMVHLLAGIVVISILTLFFLTSTQWNFFSLAFFLGILYVWLFIIFLKKRGVHLPLIDQLIKSLGWRDVFPGEGAVWYLLGVLLILSFLNKFLYVISSIYILAIGDSVSTMFVEFAKSEKERKRFSLFKNKTPLSFGAFVLFSLPLPIFLIGAKALFLVVLCAIFEAIDFKLNDNFLIPLICVLFLFFS